MLCFFRFLYDFSDSVFLRCTDIVCTLENNLILQYGDMIKPSLLQRALIFLYSPLIILNSGFLPKRTNGGQRPIPNPVFLPKRFTEVQRTIPDPGFLPKRIKDRTSKIGDQKQDNQRSGKRESTRCRGQFQIRVFAKENPCQAVPLTLLTSHINSPPSPHSLDPQQSSR